MSPSAQMGNKVESKVEAEALIPQFRLDRVLNQDQSGRRITLLGTISNQPALLTLERAAVPSDDTIITRFLTNLSNTTNLGANDVYRWYMSNHNITTLSDGSNGISTIPDLKINLIYPCTESHIRKYTAQKLRYVTETPQIYHDHVKPYVERTQRTKKRLDWIYNILDGITEQEDVVFRSPDFGLVTNSGNEVDKKGFILLPDLNWDRKTVTGLHLLALVERRDVWSLRDLKKRDVSWLKSMRNSAVVEAARYGSKLAACRGDADADANVDSNGGVMVVEPDMLKCYVHYQPTYHHFHIHIVHVQLESEGTTQSVGKAFSLENLISQLEHMSDTPDSDDDNVNGESGNMSGMDQVDISYFVGEESDLWKKCFERIKRGEKVDLNLEVD